MTGFGGTHCAGEVSPLRVLIADDSDAIRGVLRRLIGEDINGCESCGGEAVDGREVLRNAAELRPGAILLDLSIPVLAGLDAAKILQQDCPTIDVSLMSAQEPSVLTPLAANARVWAGISKTSLAHERIPLLRSISARKKAGRAAA